MLNMFHAFLEAQGAQQAVLVERLAERQPRDSYAQRERLTSARKNRSHFAGADDCSRADVDDFLQGHARFANLAGYSDEESLEELVQHLTQGAKTWYDAQSDPPTTTDAFASRLRIKYYPRDLLLTIRRALEDARMTQGLQEYNRTFERHVNDLRALPDDGNAALPAESELLRWYYNGLRARESSSRARRIFNMLMPATITFAASGTPPTLTAAMRLAELTSACLLDETEKPATHQVKRTADIAYTDPRAVKRRSSSRTSSSLRERIPPAPADVPNKDVRCFRCHEMGHRIATCTMPVPPKKAHVAQVALDQATYDDLSEEGHSASDSDVQDFPKQE